MDGTHLTHDDMFIVDEIRRRKDVVKGLEAEKRSRLAAAKRTTEALALIGSKEAQGCRVEQLLTDQKKWTNTELDVLLRWRNGGKVPQRRRKQKLPSGNDSEAYHCLYLQSGRMKTNGSCRLWNQMLLLKTPSLEESGAG